MATSTVTFTDLKTTTATLFREAIDTIPLYLWLARSQTWPNELAPPVTTKTDFENIRVRDNFRYWVRLNLPDTAIAIPRINWVQGTVYAQYSDTDPDLLTKNFYVMTGTNAIYKCISNNDGATSVDVPVGTSTNQFTTADGYVWKFMYNIPTTMNKFISSTFIPVPLGTQRTIFHTQVEEAAVYTIGGPPDGHGSSAARELGAGYLLINKVIDLSDDFDSIGATTQSPFIHRQFGLISAPTLATNALATGSHYFPDYDLPDAIDKQSGQILNCTNHAVVSGAVDTTEQIQIIISF